MTFYSQISKFYDYIFPAESKQIGFIRKTMNSNDSNNVLDIACGSGEYSVRLAELGYKVTAADIDTKMVELANDKAKSRGLNIKVIQSDMLELDKKLREFMGDNSNDQLHYDTVFCIGNSLVHIGNIVDIGKALKIMAELLEPEGKLIVQIINYDRVLKYGVSELPMIKNEVATMTFDRKYVYDKTDGMIDFNTTLKVGNEQYENSIKLLPLKSEELNKLLKDAGFRKIEFFGGFDEQTQFTDDSYVLVARAEK